MCNYELCFFNSLMPWFMPSSPELGCGFDYCSNPNLVLQCLNLTYILNFEHHLVDYDQKAEDAVDYEDIQEQYEGPEVQLAQQDMQSYANAALAGPIKLAEEDNYDDDDDIDIDIDSEQCTEAKVEDEDFNSKQPVEGKAEDEDFDSEQPADNKLESPVKNASGMVLQSLFQMFLYHPHLPAICGCGA